MRTVSVLGATGSVGETAFRILRSHRDRLRAVALTAWRRIDRLREQAWELRPDFVAVADPEAAKGATGFPCPVVAGEDGLVAAAQAAEVVLVAVVGIAGLVPTLAALQAGRRVALANKETLVAAGPLVRAAAQAGGGEILPVDSEHSALWQLLTGRAPAEVVSLTLTASGGPLRDLPVEELARVTPAMALRHPTWQMGAKITVDSATLMNKGLEVIEAHHLFGLPYDRIHVLLHRQSLVHGLVTLVDGSVLAHLGPADMTLPVQLALTHPHRLPTSAIPLDLAAVGELTFAHPDPARYPCLRLARAAGTMGGTMPAVLSAANEVAVAAFLEGRVPFVGIAEVVERVMSRHQAGPASSVEEILAADAWARAEAAKVVATRQGDGAP